MKKKLISTIKISIAGEPNVGKSTFINKVLKKKISTVTRKSQTTVKKKTDMILFKKKQFVFLDTPGIFSNKERISRSTFKQASNAILESDLVLILINALNPHIKISLEILNYIKSLDKDYLIIINKIDLLKKKNFLSTMEFFKNKFDTNELVTISALKSTGIISLLNYINENYKFYLKQVYNNKTNVIDPSFIEEIVREKVLNNIHDEIPYKLNFKTDNIKRNKDKSYKIDVSIFFKKNSHKPIILGKDGKNIKKISISARLDLEKIYKEKFHLFIYLKKINYKRVKVDNLEK
ncbi:MAG: GTPase Era [Pseudomonadota bacterium]|nr:GTPase Era [Pseudomonadota bacterium]